MNKKAVFFDADGTVCDIKKACVVQCGGSDYAAVKGHEAWLCTGRSRAFVPEYLEKIPFSTGMITACGATIEKNGTRLLTEKCLWKLRKNP